MTSTDNTNTQPKTSLTQRLRTDLGRLFGVTTAIQLVCLISVYFNHDELRCIYLVKLTCKIMKDILSIVLCASTFKILILVASCLWRTKSDITELYILPSLFLVLSNRMHIHMYKNYSHDKNSNSDYVYLSKIR